MASPPSTSSTPVSRPVAAAVPWSWRRDGAVLAGILLLAVAVFANSLRNGFVYDDVPVIENNPRLEKPFDFRTFFGTTYWDDKEQVQGLYRPLTIASFAWDRALFGPSPLGVHLVNVLLNAVVAAGVYLFLRLALLERLACAFAALLFSIHPVHTEVVANGVGRSELAAAFFLLAAGCLHLLALRRAFAEAQPLSRADRKRRDGPRAGAVSWPPYAGALALFFVGLLFKESVLVLPGLLFLIDWLLFEQGRLRQTLRRVGYYALYAAPLALFMVMRAHVAGGRLPPLQEVMYGSSFLQRFFYANEVLLAYWGQLLVPWQLCAEYSDYTDVISRTPWRPLAWVAFAAWGLLAWGLWQAWRRRAFVPVLGVLIFFVAILPVSNLVFAIGTVRADRLLYTPSLGFVLLAGWALALLARQTRPTLAWALVALVLAAYAGRSWHRNQAWASTETLWRITVKDNPGSAIAWAFLGDIARTHGEDALAEEAYAKSFALRDEAGFFYPESHNNYAKQLTKRGDLKGAEAHYRLVLQRRPNQYTALVNLGAMLLSREKDRPEAIALLRRATKVDPGRAEAFMNLAQVLRMTGDGEGALKAVEAGVPLKPDDPAVWEAKAQVHAALSQKQEAQAAMARAAALRGTVSPRRQAPAAPP